MKSLFGAVGQDFDLLKGDQAIPHHLINLRQYGADLVLAVDSLDEDGQVLREAEDSGRVKVLLRTEALDAPQHGGAGEPARAQALH